MFERAEYADLTKSLAAIGSVDKDMIFADSFDLLTPTISGDPNGYTASHPVMVDMAVGPSSSGRMGGGGQSLPGGTSPSPSS